MFVMAYKFFSCPIAWEACVDVEKAAAKRLVRNEAWNKIPRTIVRSKKEAFKSSDVAALKVFPLVSRDKLDTTTAVEV